MRKLICTVLGLGLFVAAGAAIAADGAAAAFASRLLVAGLNKAAQADATASAAARQCVADIPLDAFTATSQTLLEEALTDAELASLDAFYAGDLGVRLADGILAGKTFEQTFSAEDRQRFQAEVDPAAMQKMMAALKPLPGPENADNRLNEAMLRIAGPCRAL